MKRPLIAGVLAGAPSGLFVGAFYSDDTATSVIAGIVFGVVTALAIGGYVARSDRRWKQRHARMLSEFEPEGIVHHSDAALGGAIRMGIGIVSPMLGNTGGWLVMTTRRLVFVPHQHNLLGKRTEIAVTEITGAKRGNGLSPNAIDVYTRANQSVRITVRGPDDWLPKLNSASVTAPTATPSR